MIMGLCPASGALKQNVAVIGVVRNLPSGDPTPSAEDLAVTHEHLEAGMLPTPYILPAAVDLPPQVLFFCHI